ncbi:MAG: sigma-70 family RNA polymerase sigma factor [Acidobacteriales bacterium]|nr:sigma-70 family RNA polymerase sigma factor [Terriglobales bacterium]
MAITFSANVSGLSSYLPAVEEKLEQYRQIYENNYHRIYGLAFRMTDNELTAEELVGDVFRRAFSLVANPSSEVLDRALIRELREHVTIGPLTLTCSPATEVSNIRSNVKRVHLEQAVVELPPTERAIFLMHDVEGYDHARIGRTIGLSVEESRSGLHQARLRLRELLAKMF